MTVSGTHFNYFMVCQRKLWLLAHGITMEQESELVHEEIAVDGIKVDYYNAAKHEIHEIKKSDKLSNAALWQLKYYLYVFELHGVADIKGILEFPRQRKTQTVTLTDDDRTAIKQMLGKIEELCTQEECPQPLYKALCKKCSYYEFCYTTETEAS